MSLAQILVALEQLAVATPEIITALEQFVSALKNKQPIAPSVKLAEAIAAAKELGLDPSKV